jgi:hypothetical protein
MYRFRKIENLLGECEELEKQEIYFSDISSLNDPMEGFREYFWSGDLVVWKNLLRHYLLCLERIVMLAWVREELFTPEDIPVFLEEEILPTTEYKQMFLEICDRFFEIDGVNEYLEFLASSPRKISREELCIHLNFIHRLACHIIAEIHRERYKLQLDLSISYADYSNHLKQYVGAWRENSNNIEDLRKIDALFTRPLELEIMEGFEDIPINKRKWFAILTRFPNDYLNEIVKLTYPESYVACFVDDCTNAAVWAHYGDGYRGVCLKFKTTEKDGCPTIDLRGVTGWKKSEPVYGYQTFEFHKINYSNQFPSIDFFKSLGGRLPVPQLWRQWYGDRDGSRSSCADWMSADAIDEWRKGYWHNYERGFFTKLKDWEYEQEQRIFLSSVLDTYEKPESRKFTYKFEDLEAIIFGMRTRIEDKVKIKRIIDAKCKEHNRDNFDFYKASYSPSLGRMVITKV